jgi:hypothetical protein
MINTIQSFFSQHANFIRKSSYVIYLVLLIIIIGYAILTFSGFGKGDKEINYSGKKPTLNIIDLNNSRDFKIQQFKDDGFLEDEVIETDKSLINTTIQFGTDDQAAFSTALTDEQINSIENKISAIKNNVTTIKEVDVISSSISNSTSQSSTSSNAISVFSTSSSSIINANSSTTTISSTSTSSPSSSPANNTSVVSSSSVSNT